jgi:hypothetical protein
VAQLCVNTLLATKVSLITDEIKFGTLRVKLITYSYEQPVTDLGKPNKQMYQKFSATVAVRHDKYMVQITIN